MINFDNVIWYGIAIHFKGNFHCVILLQCDVLFLRYNINWNCVSRWHFLLWRLKNVKPLLWACQLVTCVNSTMQNVTFYLSRLLSNQHFRKYMLNQWWLSLNWPSKCTLGHWGLQCGRYKYGLSSWNSSRILPIVSDSCDWYTMKRAVVLPKNLNDDITVIKS